MLASAAVIRFFSALLVLFTGTAALMQGAEPEAQEEKHWVDSRWKETELGRFLASNIKTANGTIAKALSVKVGSPIAGAVTYDTVLGNLRVAWLGGFLEFSPARYGLMHQPRIAGDVQFVAPAKEGWNGNVRYEGHESLGERIVLTWRVNEREVRESPWFEQAGGLQIFSRTFSIAPGASALRIALVDAGIERFIEEHPAAGLGILKTPASGSMMVLAALGDGRLIAPADGAAAVLEFPAATEPTRAQLFYWRGGGARYADFVRYVESRRAADELPPSISEPRWKALTVRGEVGRGSGAWAIDTLTAPYDNPWKALLFLSGVDFLANGDAAVCTIHGDVWTVSGIDAELGQLTWRRFATGLFQPLGLRVVNDRIHILGRDRITLLEDRDGNGEADRYRNFSDLIATSTGGHDYVSSLEVDRAGNFYYVDPRGVHRISDNGRKHETIATGWRNPNGMSVGPDGTITVAPQEGNWTPASHIDEVRPGGYYGFGGPRVTPARPHGYDLPLCWIPRAVDNSSGSQVWVTSDRWGIPRGHLLHLSFGRCTFQLVLRELVDGQPQGGVVPLPGRFISGAMRGVFSQHDGQLYVVGSQGWQTAGTRDGSLQRVRFTGRKPHVPLAIAAHANGLKLTFSEPLDRVTAEDRDSYNIEQWRYEYAERYGSKEFSIRRPGETGRDAVAIETAQLLPDERSVFLRIKRAATGHANARGMEHQCGGWGDRAGRTVQYDSRAAFRIPS